MSFEADAGVPAAAAGVSNLQATCSFAILRHLALNCGFHETVVSASTYAASCVIPHLSSSNEVT